MKATKSIVLLLALNKLRKRKILFRHKMKNLLLTFALFMQKQDNYYCSGYVSQVLQNWKTRRPRRHLMINYEQMWFEKMIARKDEPIFQELWKNEFRMLPSTFDFIVNLVEADMRKEGTYFRKTISVLKRVACALWRLSTGHSYRVVSKVFGVGRSTVSQIVKEFCTTLRKKSSYFIKLNCPYLRHLKYHLGLKLQLLLRMGCLFHYEYLILHQSLQSTDCTLARLQFSCCYHAQLYMRFMRFCILSFNCFNVFSGPFSFTTVLILIQIRCCFEVCKSRKCSFHR